MSVYNSEKYLNESIESILNQTFIDFEFIIIDDCSTDNSRIILSEYAKKDNRIKRYTNETNLGLTKSLNKGLKLAKGKYIARMDADDISYSNRFQAQLEFLERNKNIYLVGSWAVEIDERGNEIDFLKPNYLSEEVRKVLSIRNAIIHPSIMFRNEGKAFYREKFKYAQDYDFYLCLLSKGKQFANIPDVLIKYRIGKTSISVKKNAHQRLFAQKANSFYRERVKSGRDTYVAFDENTILNVNAKKSTNKIALQAEIYSALKFFNEKLIRQKIKKYFKIYGYFNKFLLYFCISYFGNNFYLKVKKTLSL